MRYQLPRPVIKAYELVGFLHAGGGIPCRQYKNYQFRLSPILHFAVYIWWIRNRDWTLTIELVTCVFCSSC